MTALNLLAKELRRALPKLRLLENEPMRRHCSFRIGGPAAIFAEPAAEEEVLSLLAFLRRKGVRPVIVGNGTNLLVADEGLPGVVIHIGEAFGAVRFEGDTALCAAGALLSHVAAAARDRGLTGLEFAHGIPGSLGGAVLMNAGAYGGEMKDVVTSVRFADETGTAQETDDPGFGYRKSRFSGGGTVVLQARLRLRPGDPAAIGARMRELSGKRSASQPLNLPSAGSAFKRPAAGYAAAMIDGAGLKGFSVGGAAVSEKHAGFIVNTGDATCADVLALMEHIQRTVQRQYGVLLEPEIKRLGPKDFL